jgi:large subunit ribosomal protein L18
MSQVKHLTTKQRRKITVRKKLHGTADRPRLTVFRSNQHIYLQLIDDDAGLSLASASSASKEKKYTGTKTEKAGQVAKELAQLIKKKKIKQIVFDRGPYKYHGRVKAVAEQLREAGINF